MVDRELQAIRRPAIKALLPDEVMKQERANRSVVQQDNSLSPQALSASLPWASRDVRIDGAMPAGVAFSLAYPQACVIRRWEIRAGTAPTSDAVITLQVNGANMSSLALPTGTTTAGTNERVAVPAGAVVSFNSNILSGAADAIVTVFTSVGSTTSAGGGGGTSGGSGGGGAVDSVNGATGMVVLDADDISDTSTSHKFVTAAHLTTLANTSGTNTGDQDLSGYALVGHHHDTRYYTQAQVDALVASSGGGGGSIPIDGGGPSSTYDFTVDGGAP